MEIHYKDNEIEKICNDEKYALRQFQPKVVSDLFLLLSRLDEYQKFNVFYSYTPLWRKYQPEELKGNKTGITSLRIGRKYRMTLTVEVTKNKNGEDIITILEVSNHYGD